ncbi:hydrogenase expression/formation protein HypE [Desulforamulus aeronauticus]|uniref:Hydrogenase maturation protein, carbamoyl dehydratase HypE n=1 Tax=Desulforamulus aeronauticus DSM 10349 TaxID=1121421 RepID=A0A1M6TAW6_9FIRM|nr:hydrogenase expression/formation protein HypE [Desulforamulus aeronauticus]SHK54019.1 Hydrogenase maturation protein, carbamoyl dehydratase HypE [Desulforamulus aeronauticus DSM 10349]
MMKDDGLKGKRILLSHGDGGALTRKLIEEIFYKKFYNDILIKDQDAALLPACDRPIAMTTDSFIVKPIFFPGGDIGKLAVCGTVNDLAVSGAEAKFITTAFIIEEGFKMEDLAQIVDSMWQTARECGLTIVSGDTKVVEKGSIDGIFINTTGIGVLPAGVNLGFQQIKPGDKIIISGNIGEHGVAVMASREGFSINLSSDCAPLNRITQSILKNSQGVKFMRDPTRGGVASTLKEIAISSHNVDFCINEENLPISQEVNTVCQLLGYDPLYLANEGKILAFVAPEECEKIISLMKELPYGENTCCIGEVQEGKGDVLLKTIIGGTRKLNLLSGISLPRIC